MTRTFTTPRKTLTLKVRDNRVILKATKGSATLKFYARSFRNRYTLRRFLSAKIDAAVNAGYRAA